MDFYEFQDPLLCKVDVFCRPGRFVVFVADPRRCLLDLCTHWPIIIAVDRNELSVGGHGRTPGNTIVLAIGTMSTIAANARLLFLFIVTGSNGRNEEQLIFVGNLL